ncbi:MAG: hypothetical protein GEU79_14455 [Acidimicrobiia bacterium]|nr:hypothetical protein [Acidimicrobiia bacterium]
MKSRSSRQVLNIAHPRVAGIVEVIAMSRLHLARVFLVVTALSLFVASLIHFGYLVEGYDDRGAATPEAVIGAVMVVGLVLSWVRPAWGRQALVGALAFGLAGSTLGLVLVFVGVGPQTTPDIIYHVSLVVALVIGLYLAITSEPTTSSI